MQKLLIIDDEENMRHMLSVMLTRHGYSVMTAEGVDAAMGCLRKESFDYILCDVRMPDKDGLQFLKEASGLTDDCTIVMMSAYGSIDMALEAIKRGAYDFISKPFKSDEVLLTLKKADEREVLRRENKKLQQELKVIRHGGQFGALVGESKAMQAIFQLAEKIAKYPSTVLITGESGTGKELVAQAIHDHSPREAKKMVSVNCASIPESLLESEFFGHTRGAFTGADRERKGMFEEAHGSTLFLDEIAELPLGLQVKLLRVLQEGEIRPLGSSQNKKVDVRIVAATSRNLREMIDNGFFREDLYYRLNVVNIHIPPLRDRKEDIPLLCRHFINKYNVKLGISVKTVASSAMYLLMNHDWPGNVRELENTVQRSMVLSEGDELRHIELSGRSIRSAEADFPAVDFDGSLSLKLAQKKIEEQLIRKALQETGGNRSKAAILLELSYPSLLAKIKEYAIQL